MLVVGRPKSVAVVAPALIKKEEGVSWELFVELKFNRPMLSVFYLLPECFVRNLLFADCRMIGTVKGTLGVDHMLVCKMPKCRQKK